MQRQQVSREPKKPSFVLFIVLLALGLIVGLPVLVAGVALTVTVVLAPLGIPLILMSALPMFAVINHHQHKLAAFENRNHVMPNENGVPWDTSAGYDEYGNCLN